MQGKDTTISTFDQLFKLFSIEKFQQLLDELGVDKYTKKLYTTQLIMLMAYAQLEQHRGLRDISIKCPPCQDKNLNFLSEPDISF